MNNTRAIIGILNSSAASHDVPRKSWPAKKTDIAKGKVSRIGALDEISPSRLSPRRRLKNEPVLSPTRHMKPRNVPRMKAESIVLSTENQVPAEPASGDENNTVLSWIAPAALPSLVASTINMHKSPEENDPPMRPFQVFPSPRIRFPSLRVRPPSMGQGPYPVFGSHFPHIMAKEFAKKPGKYSHKHRRKSMKKFNGCPPHKLLS